MKYFDCSGCKVDGKVVWCKNDEWECVPDSSLMMEDTDMGDSISDTHEWRKLGDFRVGQTIYRWGDDLPVVNVQVLSGDRVLLTYHDTDDVDKSIQNLSTKEYIARKDSAL